MIEQGGAAPKGLDNVIPFGIPIGCFDGDSIRLRAIEKPDGPGRVAGETRGEKGPGDQARKEGADSATHLVHLHRGCRGLFLSLRGLDLAVEFELALGAFAIALLREDLSDGVMRERVLGLELDDFVKP